jgi:MYXO-CTERM domain-containing protein
VVAFGAGEYLVVWDSGSPTTGIMAARVHGDGTLIDTTPFPIALQQIQTNPTSSDTPRKPAVSFDGARFVVVWDAQTINSSNVQSTSIRLAHVTAGGQVVGPLSVTTSDTSYGAGNTHAVGGGGGGRSIVSYPLYDRPAGYDLARVRVRLFADQASSAGGACVNNSDCAAGTCVDGVCCATACAGGALDCQACSIIAGAAMNGTCAPLPDGLACGSRGSCAAGICVEPPDAGAGDALSDGGGAGDAPRADGGADAAGDGGGPADGARADAGTGTDASTSDRAGGDGGGADAAVSTDAPSPDAGARADGRDAPGGDGSVNDAAAMPPRRLASSGCGCSTAAGSDRGGVPAAPIALAVAALIVLRRRRAPR